MSAGEGEGEADAHATSPERELTAREVELQVLDIRLIFDAGHHGTLPLSDAALLSWAGMGPMFALRNLVRLGCLGVAKQLLDLRPELDLSERDSSGLCVFLQACSMGREAIACLLVDAGADPHVLAASGRDALAVHVDGGGDPDQGMGPWLASLRLRGELAAEVALVAERRRLGL